MDLNKFYLMDVMDGLSELEENSADVIIIDPPYNIKKDFGNNKDDMDLLEYVKWSKSWLTRSYTILKDTGSMYIYGYSEILAHLSVSMYPIQSRWLIWHYTNKSTPSYKNGWQRSHEAILLVTKNNPIFNVDDVRTPYTDVFLKNSVGKKRVAGRSRFDGNKETVYKAHKNGALPRDVFSISALAGGAGRKERYFLHNDIVYESKHWKEFNESECIKHPTQKPSKLTQKLLLSSKPKQGCGLLVIPFGGSGSEGVVAKQLGMNFIGFDINPDYIKLSNGAVSIYDTIFD